MLRNNHGNNSGFLDGNIADLRRRMDLPAFLCTAVEKGEEQKFAVHHFVACGFAFLCGCAGGIAPDHHRFDDGVGLNSMGVLHFGNTPINVVVNDCLVQHWRAANA